MLELIRRSSEVNDCMAKVPCLLVNSGDELLHLTTESSSGEFSFEYLLRPQFSNRGTGATVGTWDAFSCTQESFC